MANQPDPQLENLESFITLLEQTLEKVREDRPKLDAHAKTLGDIKEDVDRELGDMDQDLDERAAELERLADETRAALETLESTSSTGTEATLEDATSAFDDWKGRLEGVLEEASERARGAGDEVVSDGFEEASETLTDLNEDLVQSRSDLDTAFDALGSKLGNSRERFVGALTKASVAANEAADSAREALGTIRGSLDEVESAIASTASSAVSSHSETRSGAESLYEAVGTEADSEASQTRDEIAQLFETEATQMKEELEAALVESADSVEQGALSPLREGIGEWASLEGSAERQLASFDRFVEELSTTLVVLRLIDEVQESMD